MEQNSLEGRQKLYQGAKNSSDKLSAIKSEYTFWSMVKLWSISRKYL